MMTATQLATHWKVHPATVGRAITKARLPKARGVTYDDAQVAQIRACLPSLQRKTQRKAPRMHHAVQPSTAPSAHAADPTRQQIAYLEARVAALEKQLAAQSHQINVIVNWGRNTARIIRTLWHRMPDYQQGDTPGEFPAVITELLDEGGQAMTASMLEEDQRTEAFFASLDQQRKTSRE